MTDRPQNRLYRPLNLCLVDVIPGDNVPGDNGARDIVTLTITDPKQRVTTGERLEVVLYESQRERGVIVIEVTGDIGGAMRAVRLVVNDQTVATVGDTEPG